MPVFATVTACVCAFDSETLAADQTRTGGAQPVRGQGLDRGFDHLGVDGQAEIIVAGQIDDLVVGRPRPQLAGEAGLRPGAGQALERVQPACQNSLTITVVKTNNAGKLSPATDSSAGLEAL